MTAGTISITLSEKQLGELQSIADRLHLTPEDLARAGVEDLLKRADEAFQGASDRVLSKNAELYRRLA